MASKRPFFMENTKKLIVNISNLSDQTKREKNEDVKKMIDYYNNLTSEIEDRRNRVYENSLTLLLVIITAIALLFSNVNQQRWMFIPMISFFTMLISLIILVCVFFWQNESNYVFKDSSLIEYSNKWKWFYHGNKNIKEINIYNYSTNNSIRHYIDGLNLFLEKYITETTNSELTDNLQQLYLLQVHNYYKNKYYLQLVHIQKWGLISSLLVALITTIFVLKFYIPIVA